VTIVGTRPEIIRLSLVMRLLDKYLDHISVHTGQNYDYELNEIFYKDLGLRKPDYHLNVNTSSLGHVLGDTLIKIEEVFNKEKPEAALILGDTNSSISAIIAKRMKIPIFHMEAGNRSFDGNVPEEINRKIIDHTADFNLVYTEHSRRHLLAEGIPHRNIYLTGSPMYEVLDCYRENINASDILEKLSLEPKNYFVASIHREENVDHEENLKIILSSLNTMAEEYNLPIIVSTHPRTARHIGNIQENQMNPLIVFSKPFGFFDYNKLQVNARCVISDSGTISEEAHILNFPAISMRNSMERPEALDAGTVVLTGLDAEIIMDAIHVTICEHVNDTNNSKIPGYEIKNTSWRVLKIIKGLARLSPRWNGIQGFQG
jgi:UDP-N-acetyl-L-fucosamine synthase